MATYVGSSPRVWGQVISSKFKRETHRIIPTRMWTSMKIVQDFYKAEDHPHAYGDKRYNLYTSPNYLGSSPRVWGQDPNEIAAGENTRIIPTRMGTSIKDKKRILTD